MARGAAKSDAEQDFVAMSNGFDADVVGVFDGADEASAVVGDIEFTWQIVEGTIVDDRSGEFVEKRQNIDQLDRVDPGGGIGSEVADIIGSGAAGMKADALDAAQDFRSVFGLDEPHLQIRASGNLHVSS